MIGRFSGYVVNTAFTFTSNRAGISRPSPSLIEMEEVDLLPSKNASHKNDGGPCSRCSPQKGSLMNPMGVVWQSLRSPPQRNHCPAASGRLPSSPFPVTQARWHRLHEATRAGPDSASAPCSRTGTSLALHPPERGLMPFSPTANDNLGPCGGPWPGTPPLLAVLVEFTLWYELTPLWARPAGARRPENTVQCRNLSITR
jgi:hypothetical protein